MFGKRGGTSVAPRIDPQPAPAARETPPSMRPAATPAAPPRFEAGTQLSATTTTTVSSPPIAPAAPPPPVMSNHRSESFYETKGQIFGALIEAIELNTLRLSIASGNSTSNSPSSANMTFTLACEVMPA